MITTIKWQTHVATQLISAQYEENYDPHALMAIAGELENKYQSLITAIQNSETYEKWTIKIRYVTKLVACTPTSTN